MEIILVIMIVLALMGGGILFWWRKRKNVSDKPEDSPREHESVYEMPAIRMTDEGELTDSFIVEMKTLKKYRDELVNDDNQK